MVLKDKVEKLVYLLSVLGLIDGVLGPRMVVIHPLEAGAILSLVCHRYVPQDQLHLIFGYLLVIVCIITPEGDQHLLFEAAHEQSGEKLDELIVVYALISVGVDLVDDPLSNELWQIHVLFRPFARQIVLILSFYQTEVHAGEIRRKYFSYEKSILFRHKVFHLYRVCLGNVRVFFPSKIGGTTNRLGLSQLRLEVRAASRQR